MYNSGNSSKNVTGASIVDGTVETVDIADDAVTADKLANSVNTDIATGVSGSTTAGDALPKAGGAMTGAITTTSTFDGRDVSVDGTKLDTVETNADVTDTANVTAAGALMDSEVTNLADVKAFDTTDYATSTQGTTADNALPKAGGTMTGPIVDLTATGNIVVTALGNATEELARFSNNDGLQELIIAKNGSTAYEIKSSLDLKLHADYDNDTSAGASSIFMYTDATERMRILPSGGVCVGNTVVNLASGFTNQAGIGLNPNGEIQAARNGTAMQLGRFASTGDVAAFRYEGTSVGGISVTGSATSYNTSSDYRLKENVVPMTGYVDRLKALNPSRFNFISDVDTTVDGFLAHEAGEVVPECATGTKDAMKTEEYEVTPAVEAVLDADGSVTTEAVEAVMGTREVEDYQGIDQSKLVPLLVSALQEAIARIETLENA